MPRSSNTSRLRGWMPLPREPWNGWAAASISRNATSRRASSTASVRPAAPAPQISTSVANCSSKAVSKPLYDAANPEEFLRAASAQDLAVRRGISQGQDRHHHPDRLDRAAWPDRADRHRRADRRDDRPRRRREGRRAGGADDLGRHGTASPRLPGLGDAQADDADRRGARQRDLAGTAWLHPLLLRQRP